MKPRQYVSEKVPDTVMISEGFRHPFSSGRDGEVHQGRE